VGSDPELNRASSGSAGDPETGAPEIGAPETGGPETGGTAAKPWPLVRGSTCSVITPTSAAAALSADRTAATPLRTVAPTASASEVRPDVSATAWRSAAMAVSASG
jgi:hypothetical protein